MLVALAFTSVLPCGPCLYCQPLCLWGPQTFPLALRTLQNQPAVLSNMSQLSAYPQPSRLACWGLLSTSPGNRMCGPQMKMQAPGSKVKNFKTMMTES